MKCRFIFLGTGASAGVPVIGCSCTVCQSSSPYNKRLRTSGLLEVEGKKLLIDAGPDFRAQALKYRIDHLDGVLLTHTHYDHIGGLDELRVFYFKKKKALPCLLSQESLEELEVRYPYFMRPVGEGSPVAAQLEFYPVSQKWGHVEFGGLLWRYVSYFQAGMKVLGYRLGSFAYISDIRDYSPELFLQLQGVETLVVSALRHTASSMHFSLEEGITFAKKVGASRTFFTHIAHDLDHESTNKILPKEVQLSYDGLEMEFTI